MSHEITSLTAAELADAYRARTLSPVEVTEAVIARIDALEPDVHAFFTRTNEIALEEAAASEKRFAQGVPLGLMDGIPYSIKDLEETAGVRTTGADPARRDEVPDFDTAVAGRLRRSGGALLGKTSVPHIGYKDSPENLLFPDTGNPWNTGRNPGGSSSGAAAAVAAGFGPLAQGSDGAGSIRIPAALCGVVGFKATLGRVPVWPNALPYGSTVHNGPIARSVRDAALMLDVMAGPDARDPNSNLPVDGNSYLKAVEKVPVSPRIAYSIDFGYGTVSDAVRGTIENVVPAVARELHWRIEQRDPGFGDPGDAQETRWDALMAAAFGERLVAQPDDFEPMFQEIIRAGLKHSALDLMRAEWGRSLVNDALVDFFSEVDYLVSPTMPMGAWPLRTYPTTVDGRDLPGGAVLRRAFLCWPFNLTGNPAITIPCGLDDGMPIGLQVVGRKNDDAGVLRVAAAIERVLQFDIAPAHAAVAVTG
ncbi:amidase [Streptomyces sp. NPDC055006]